MPAIASFGVMCIYLVFLEEVIMGPAVLGGVVFQGRFPFVQLVNVDVYSKDPNYISRGL